MTPAIRLVQAISAWFEVRNARDGETRRRAELIVLAASIWLIWMLLAVSTVPIPPGHTPEWLFFMVGGVVASALLVFYARRGKTERASYLFTSFILICALIAAWLLGPNSMRWSLVIPFIVVVGCFTEAWLVLAFSGALALMMAALVLAEKIGVHRHVLAEFEPTWVPFLRQVPVVCALGIVLRRGYDRAYRQMVERERASREAVDAARAIAASLEERVEQRTAALSETQKRLSAFAQHVLDDLTADLSVVRERLSAFLVAEKLLGPTRLADVVEAADAVDRLSTMIERLHQHASLGAAALRPAEIDMEALVREVVNQYGRGANGKIEWTIGSLPRAWADPPLVRAVLENLVTNAIKFSRGRAPACIEIGFRGESGAYFVRDNGVGFDAHLATKLFAPFRRLHLESEFEGHGVGLANVRRIVERSGGHVSIAGERDRGAQVEFSIPLFQEGSP